MQYAMALASEKGTSSWLLALPLKEHGFNLSKSDFRYALCLRYGWQLPRMLAICACGQQFNSDHMLSCRTGGLPSLRHNEIHDYLATTLSEVCSDVAIEPTLQPLNGEEFVRCTAEMKTLASTFTLMASGEVEGSTAHSLMYGCSIPLRSRTVSPLWILYIDSTNARNSGNTRSGSSMSNMQLSLPWFCHALPEQVGSLPSFCSI